MVSISSESSRSFCSSTHLPGDLMSCTCVPVDTRLAGAAEGGLGEEETANTDSRDDDGGDLDRESQLTSGLSASSNSLTDVSV